jgi:hypothetical protein
MSLPELDNLVRIGQLKAEPRNATEVTRMLAMAQTRLGDAKLSNVSLEGRFTSAYNAAHAAALAALRWHGYRSENGYTVFNAWRTLWVGTPTGGACWTPRIKNGIWLSTRATLKSKNPPWPRCALWSKP